MKNVKKNGGFTLVELIVVIAILAILAAVAIPAYSGYIAKAEEANDLQLLGALNTSFNAACVENNIFDMDAMEGAQFELTGTEGAKRITGLTLPAGYAATLSNAPVANDPATILYNSFVTYYGDNINTAFKVYVLIVFEDGGFVGKDAEEAEGYIIEAVKNAIINSNYNGKITELTGDVGTLVDNLKGYLASDAAQSITGGGFDTYMKETLGLAEPNEQEMANAAVLYLGHVAANMDTEAVEAAKMNVAGSIFGLASKLADSDPTNDTLDLLAAGSIVEESQLASYAALYATAEAVALSEQAKGNTAAMNALKSANPSSPQSVVEAVSNVFKAAGSNALMDYIGEDPADSPLMNDMDAYFETMKAVNSKENDLKGKLDTENLYTTDESILDMLAKLQG